MALHDRDYYREPDSPTSFRPASMVAILMYAAGGIWLLQVALVHHFELETVLGCRPSDLFGRLYLWQPLTANFLHNTKEPFHLLANLFFLYLFGRELETILGRWQFLAFFLLAGTIGILVEAAIKHYQHQEAVIYGASAGVMGVVALFTCLFPRRQIYLLFMIAMPVWLLCVLFFIADLYGALGGAPDNPQGGKVAFVAHLAGAAVGGLWWLAGSPGAWVRPLMERLRRSAPHRTAPHQNVTQRKTSRPAPRPRRAAPPPSEEHEGLERGPPSGQEARDQVSAKIDQLLEKISRSGQASLTPEELDYLQQNSKRYRSE